MPQRSTTQFRQLTSRRFRWWTWRRWALAFVFAATFGYSLVALGAYLFVRNVRGISTAQYFDLWLPSRWPEYRKTRGKHYLAEGKAKLQQGEYREAFTLLKIGLGSLPSDRNGRLALAQLQTDFRRPDLAEESLEAGLPFHRKDPDYIRPYLQFLFQQQKDTRVLELCRELLPLFPDATVRDRYLVLAAATANYNRGHFDQAEDYIRLGELQHKKEGRLLAQKIDWERGYRDLALNDLRALAEEYSGDSQVYTELNARLQATGLLNEARRQSLTFSIAYPNDPRPKIDLLISARKSGDTSGAAQEIEVLIRDFPSNSGTILALAEFAANTGDDALALRLYHRAQQQRLPSVPLALLSIEALLVARKHQPALNLTRTLLEANPDWAKTHQPLFTSLQAIAHFGLGDQDAGELYLAHFNAHGQPRAENLLAIANRLLDVSATEPALRLLNRAIEIDPLNEAVLSRLVTLEVTHRRTDKLATHLRQLLTMRRPSPDLLRVAHHQLGGDAFLFTPDRAPVLASIRTHLDADLARARRHP